MNQQTVFHLRFGEKKHIENLKTLMQKVLEPAGFSMIILEIDKNFVYESHPQVCEGEHSLTKEDAAELQKYARSLGIEIVPLFQCLGHQGWGGSRSGLLRAYPEFDETPATPLDAEWPEIFCRSWCPQHPNVNSVVFDLLEEMIEAFDAKYFHIGMDEVYEIVSDQCDRCRGGSRPELFTKAVTDMYNYLSEEKNLTVMMWGDRLIKAEDFGYDNWEGDTFGTHEAIHDIPKDIIICDWHYDERKSFPTPTYFMEHGFRVLPACWFKENVAKELFQETEQDAQNMDKENQVFGRLVTSWNSWNKEAYELFNQFAEGYEGKKDDELYRLFGTIQSVKSF